MRPVEAAVVSVAHWEEAVRSAREHVLLRCRPSPWRERPLLFVVCLLLSPFLIGLVALIVWVLRCRSTTLTVTTGGVELRRGTPNPRVYRLRHRDIRFAKVEQGRLQKTLATGRLTVGTGRDGGGEIQVAGLPNVEEVARTVRRLMGQDDGD